MLSYRLPVFAALLVIPLCAAQALEYPARPRTASGAPAKAPPGPQRTNPCAAQGADFQPTAGGGCIRVFGGVRTEVGGTHRAR